MSKEEAVEVEESHLEISNSANNESDSVQIQESASATTEPSNSNRPASDQGIVPSVVHTLTGPRTSAGKEKSKHNALKHGIFSKILLLGSESRLEFNSVLNGLRNDLRPEGALEEILVEKLASLLWRYRRMLIAERAEIQRETKYSGWDEFVRTDPEATIFLRNEGKGKKKPGLILGIENPVILARCVEQLQLLKNLIETRGLDSKVDMHILNTVYGEDSESSWKQDIVLFYVINGSIDNWDPPTWALEQDGLSPEEGEALTVKLRQESNENKRTSFLKKLQEELNKLTTHAGLLEKVTAPKDKLEGLCGNVLEGPRLDRLLRYEASLDRSFDRTLSQLERVQRMRLGQPVLPELKVRHSLS